MEEQSLMNSIIRYTSSVNFKERLLNVKTLSSFVRYILMSSLSLILSSLVFYVITKWFTVAIDANDLHRTVSFGLIAFIILLSICGWSVFLTGVFVLHSRIRWFFLLPIIGFLCFAPLSNLILFATTSQSFFFFISTSVIQFIAIIVILLWSIRLTVNPSFSPEKIKTFSLLVSAFAIIIYFSADISLNLFQNFGWIKTYLDPVKLFVQTLPFITSGIIIWSSTDFIEWGQFILSSVAGRVTRTRVYWFIFILLASVAVGSITEIGLRPNSYKLIPSVIVSGIVVGIFALITYNVRTAITLPQDIPLLTMLFATMFLYFTVYGTSLLAHAITLKFDLPQASENFVLTIISLSTSIGILCVSLYWLYQRSGSPQVSHRASALFLTMLSLLIISLNLPQFINGLHFPLFPLLQPSPASFRAIVIIITMTLFSWYLVRRKLNHNKITYAIAALLLIVGLQLIGWYYQYFLPNIHSIALHSVIISTVFLIVAILWDIFLSGDQFTNKTGKFFPREGRVLLYIGYILNATALTLFYLSGVSEIKASTNEGYLEVVGAFGLGIPMVLYKFAQQVGRQK